MGRSVGLTPAEWILRGILAVAAVLTAAGLYWAWPPPSKIFNWQPDHTAEWLGWIGILGLIIAIGQLIVTATAAKEAKWAVDDALKHLGTFDLTVDVQSAIDAIDRAATAFSSRQYIEARHQCVRVLEIIARAKPQILKLSGEDQKCIDDARLEVVSARTAADRGARRATGLGADEQEALIRTLEDSKTDLLSTLQSWRIPVSGGK